MSRNYCREEAAKRKDMGGICQGFPGSLAQILSEMHVATVAKAQVYMHADVGQGEGLEARFAHAADKDIYFPAFMFCYS